jgi:hypothetical protein
LIAPIYKVKVLIVKVLELLEEGGLLHLEIHNFKEAKQCMVRSKLIPKLDLIFLEVQVVPCKLYNMDLLKILMREQVLMPRL